MPVQSPGLALHERVPASRWCVTRKDLIDFETEVRTWHHAGRIPQSSRSQNSAQNITEEGPSMYEVTEHFIKPVTLDAGGMSYALMLHPEGLECDLFVTHAWAEGIYEFCATVRRAWPRRAKNLWCCFLANPQNGGLGDLIGKDVCQSPFALALHSASHMIAIPNRVVSIYSRLWCVYEAKLAMDLQVKVTLPSASMCSVVKAMLVAVDSGLISFAIVLLMIFLGGLVGHNISPIASYSTVSVLMLSGFGMRCMTQVPTKKLAADMLVIGALLALLYVSWLKLYRKLKPLNCFMEPKQLSLLQKSHLFANLLRAAGSCVTALIFERVLEKARETALSQEAHLLEFSSVRDASCFNNEDAHALRSEMKGKEDEIDSMIKVLRAAGAYDSDVRADLEMGIDPSCGRRIKPVRATVVCFLWAVCFQANLADAQPATPFGYWTFYMPWTSFGIAGIAPAFVALFITHDRLYRRRIQYVVMTMWRGVLIIIQCYCLSAAVSSFPLLAESLRYTIARSVHGMCWSYCVVFSLSAFCAIQGPQCTRLIRQAIHSRNYITPLMFCIVPLLVPSMLQHFLCTFEQCVANSGLEKDQIWVCTKSWTIHFATTCLGVMIYAAFLVRRLKHLDMIPVFERPSASIHEAEMVNISLHKSAPEGAPEKDSPTGPHPATATSWLEYSSISTRLFNSKSTGSEEYQEKCSRASSFVCIVLVISTVSLLLPDDASRQEGVMTCPGPVEAVAFSPDGTYMVTASHSESTFEEEGWLSLWEMKTGWETKRLRVAQLVTAVACSPDGHQVLTGFTNGTARLWDAHRGLPLQQFEAREAAVISMALSPDGQQVLTGFQDGTAQLWQTVTGKQIMQFKGPNAAILSVAFSLDGQQILTGSVVDVSVWEASTGKQKTIRKADWSVADVTCVAFSPDGRYVLTGSRNGVAQLYTTHPVTEIKKFRSQFAAVSSLAFSPDGQEVLIGSEDGTVRLLQAHTGTELQKFEGHHALVASVAFSPDGHQVLAGSSDNTARLWQAHTGKLLVQFQGHTAAVTSVAFSPSGQQILTGSDDKTAKLWDAGTGRELKTVHGHDARVTIVAFGADGQQILTSSDDGTVSLCEVHACKEFRRFQAHDAAVTSAAFSSDGRQALVGSKYGMTQMFDVRTGRELQKFGGHTAAVKSAVFSLDGEQVFTASTDGTARLWSATTGEELNTFNFKAWDVSMVTVAFTPNGVRILTVSALDAAMLWEGGPGNKLRELNEFHLGYHAMVTGHSHAITSVALTPDAKQLLTGSKDGTARLWEANTGQIRLIDMRHVDVVSSLAFSRDGRYVLTGSLDRTARLWEASTGKVLMIFRGHTDYVFSVAFSPDGEQVLTGSRDCTAKLWEAGTGRELGKFHCGHFVNSVAFSPDGQRVLTGTTFSVMLWDVRTGRALMQFGRNRGPPRNLPLRPALRICVISDPSITSRVAVAFSPDGQQVLASFFDKAVVVWEARTGRELKRFQGHDATVTSVAFSPDGQQVLTGSRDSSVYLWEARTGKQLRRFQGHDAEVTSVAFSPDGQQVLTGSQDQTAKLWEASTGEELAEFQGRNAAVTSVAFSPDGQLALVASDITAKSWKLSSATLFHEYGLPCRYWLSA